MHHLVPEGVAFVDDRVLCHPPGLPSGADP
jgi:hypothetical protein